MPLRSKGCSVFHPTPGGIVKFKIWAKASILSVPAYCLIPKNFMFTVHVLFNVNFSTDLHFSDVCRSVNDLGSRTNRMKPKWVHVNFASDRL